jgi:hypothetical protein
MNDLSKVIVTFIAALAVVVVLSLLMAYPIMWLWNWALVPAVDGINLISFWQAYGLNILFTVLFKSTNYKSNK